MQQPASYTHTKFNYVFFSLCLYIYIKVAICSLWTVCPCFLQAKRIKLDVIRKTVGSDQDPVYKSKSKINL